VFSIGRKLHRETIIVVPPLAWDGSSGVDERRVILRLGFLLSGYCAQKWYWEIFDMIRKLILATILVMAYDGSPLQWAWSMLVTFFALISHLLAQPYLNAGLNVHQRLVLISQFLTTFGLMLFTLSDYMNSDYETDESQINTEAIAGLIILVNLFASVLYPCYRFYLAWTESGDKSIVSSLWDLLKLCLPAGILVTCNHMARSYNETKQIKSWMKQLSSFFACFFSGDEARELQAHPSRGATSSSLPTQSGHQAGEQSFFAQPMKGPPAAKTMGETAEAAREHVNRRGEWDRSLIAVRL